MSFFLKKGQLDLHEFLAVRKLVAVTKWERSLSSGSASLSAAGTPLLYYFIFKIGVYLDSDRYILSGTFSNLTANLFKNDVKNRNCIVNKSYKVNFESNKK